MSELDLAALRAAAEAATPGPWFVKATTDPPTALALLDRLEAAEASLARVEALAAEWATSPNAGAWHARHIRAALEGQ